MTVLLDMPMRRLQARCLGWGSQLENVLFGNFSEKMRALKAIAVLS